MEDKIRNTFEHIHAKQETIDSTKMRLNEIRKAQEEKEIIRRYKKRMRARVALAMAMLAVVVMVFGYHVNTTEAAYISVDGASSIELTINSMHRVIEAKAFNKRAQAILDSQNLKGKSYVDAVEEILSSDAYQSGKISISLISLDKENAERLLGEMSDFNQECQLLDMEQYAIAHEAGLSFGKYQYYEKLHEKDEKATAKDCEDMSLDEIEEHIKACDEEEKTHHQATTESHHKKHKSEHSGKHHKD